MVSKNELRINNLLIYEGKPIKVDEDFLEVLFAARNYEDLEPVPITSEILEKAGFNIKEPCGTFAWKFSPAGETISVKCEYLHQLQNLYFALTGQELNVKL